MNAELSVDDGNGFQSLGRVTSYVAGGAVPARPKYRRVQLSDLKEFNFTMTVDEPIEANVARIAKEKGISVEELWAQICKEEPES